MIEDIIKERIREIPISGFWYSESLWGGTFLTTLKLVSTALSHAVNENLIVRRVSNISKCVSTVSEQFFFWSGVKKSIRNANNNRDLFIALGRDKFEGQDADNIIPSSKSYMLVTQKLFYNSLSIANVSLILISTGLFELMSLKKNQSGFDNPYYKIVFICDCLSALSSLVAQGYIRYAIDTHEKRCKTGVLLLEGFEKGRELEQQHGDPILNPT